MFDIIKEMFVVLLASIVDASTHTKYVSLSNQNWKIQPTLYYSIYLNPIEYNEELSCYSFVVKLDKCAVSCNTLNDLSSRVLVPNKAEYLNQTVFNMITENKSKTLRKHIMAMASFSCLF